MLKLWTVVHNKCGKILKRININKVRDDITIHIGNEN